MSHSMLTEPFNSNQARPHQQEPRGWHSRGYLPHFDAGPTPQSITFRLFDSLPAKLLDEWSEELDRMPPEQAKQKRFEWIEKYLDQGMGSAWLKTPKIAKVVEDTILHFDADRYQLHAWVIMPNHVHLLLTPTDGQPLSTILQLVKTFSARNANSILVRRGKFWQSDYFDRLIRDERHFYTAHDYIENNPIKAGLCDRPEDWMFSSARRRESLVRT